MEATADNYFGIPGKKTESTVQVINRSTMEVKLNKISWTGNDDTTTSLMLKPNELYTFRHIHNLSSGTPYSDPYWLTNENSYEGFYRVDDLKKTGKPENDPAITVTFDVDIAGSEFKTSTVMWFIKVSIRLKERDTGRLKFFRRSTVNFSSKAFVLEP